MTLWGQRLAIAVVILMFAQASLGRAFPEAYTDVAWISASWIGNDWITLLVATPLLLGGLLLGQRSARARALALGVLAYVIYNYSFYLFGARLNAFLPLYVHSIVSATASLLIELLASLRSPAPCQFRPHQLVGGYLILVAIVLASIWLTFWAAFVFGSEPTPIEPEAFKVVAATDLLLLVPLLLAGGLLLWLRRPAGQLIGSVAAVQSALYLLVLTVNSAVLIGLGLSQPPGELPIWAPLTLFTSGAAVLLLAGYRKEEVD